MSPSFRDLAVDGLNRVLVVNRGDRTIQAIVVVASADDMFFQIVERTLMEPTARRTLIGLMVLR